MNPTRDCDRRIEDLSDYLDTGVCADPEHIKHCPQCQARLAGLRSLRSVAMDLMEDDAASADDTIWLDGILANLSLETSAGRSIPIAGGPLDQLTESEGAVIAMVRSVGDSVGGVLIGRCRIEGDAEIVGAPIEFRIGVSARYGYPLPSLAEKLRDAVFAELLAETELNVVAVHVTFTDVRRRFETAGDADRTEQP